MLAISSAVGGLKGASSSKYFWTSGLMAPLTNTNRNLAPAARSPSIWTGNQ